MPESDLALLIDAARAAGRIARPYWKANPEVWHKPDEQGPVTEADLAVDKMLKAELLSSRPDYGWLSEETEDSPGNRDADRTFIVDPIDGTRAFINGETSWAHAIAIAERGEIRAGVVYLPCLDRMYAAHIGGGATLNGDPIRASTRTALNGAQVLSNKASLRDDHWIAPLPVKRHFRSSLAYRMCLVAEGRFDAMITLRAAWEWDIAAGALIATEAGAAVLTQTGALHRYNAKHPAADGVIAAPPVLGQAILGQLKRPAA